MEMITMNVDGMSCGHCVKTIENHIGKLDGVKSVNVHLAGGTVEVSFEHAIINVETIKKEIEEIGYEVKP